MNIPREDVLLALDAIQDPISLFESVYHDGGDAIYVMDQVSDEKITMTTGLRIFQLMKPYHAYRKEKG